MQLSVSADDGLGLVDDPTGGDRVRCAADHRAVEPLHEVHAHQGPACQGERSVQELLSPIAIAAREAHLGEPLQAQCLTGGCVDVAVELRRLGELPLGGVEVAHERAASPIERGGERHSPERSGIQGFAPQVLGLGDDLGIRDRSVEQVLRDAQVRVEHGRREALLALRSPHLAREAFEPLAPLVRDQALQPHEVRQVPAVVGEREHVARLAGDRPTRSSMSPAKYAMVPRATRIGPSAASPSGSRPASAARAVSRSPAAVAARASRARTSRSSVPVASGSASA